MNRKAILPAGALWLLTAAIAAPCDAQTPASPPLATSGDTSASPAIGPEEAKFHVGFTTTPKNGVPTSGWVVSLAVPITNRSEEDLQQKSKEKTHQKTPPKPAPRTRLGFSVVGTVGETWTGPLESDARARSVYLLDGIRVSLHVPRAAIFGQVQGGAHVHAPASKDVPRWAWDVSSGVDLEVGRSAAVRFEIGYGNLSTVAPRQLTASSGLVIRLKAAKPKMPAEESDETSKTASGQR